MEWLGRIFQKIFGSANDRLLKRLWPVVDRINALEPEFNVLTDEALRAKTGEYRARLEKGEALDDLLPEAFAAVREAARRAIGHAPLRRAADRRHRAAPAARSRRWSPARARRSWRRWPPTSTPCPATASTSSPSTTTWPSVTREWMAPVYNMLGLRWARSCDITYGTNNEFGFDYLRDNMAFTAEQRVQRDLLRHRRRGRLDPDRRGAHAADHLGPSEGSTDLYRRSTRSSRS
jgi:preprotein translocase subunit SecA